MGIVKKIEQESNPSSNTRSVIAFCLNIRDTSQISSENATDKPNRKADG